MPTLRQQYRREYAAFYDAKYRCTNPNVKRYPDYGGRGIEFRFETFEQFIAEMGPRPDGYQLDRIDNDGHYEPGNVRWTTRTINTRNQRKTRMITYQGKTQSLFDWAEELDMKPNTIAARLAKGLPVDQIFCRTKHQRWNVYGPLPACSRIQPPKV